MSIHFTRQFPPKRLSICVLSSASQLLFSATMVCQWCISCLCSPCRCYQTPLWSLWKVSGDPGRNYIKYDFMQNKANDLISWMLWLCLWNCSTVTRLIGGCYLHACTGMHTPPFLFFQSLMWKQRGRGEKIKQLYWGRQKVCACMSVLTTCVCFLFIDHCLLLN